MANILEKIRDNITCVICQEMVVEAATIPCGHTFCMDCIVTSRNTSGDFAQKGKKFSRCPQCRVYSGSSIKKNIMLDEIIKKLGGPEYEKRIKEYEEDSDNRKTLRKYAKTERFRLLYTMMQQFIIKKESISLKKFIRHFKEYPKIEIMYILYNNCMDLITVYKDILIFRHKPALTRFFEDHFEELDPDDHVFFLNAMNGGHVEDVLKKKYTFRSPTLASIECFYETNKKKIIKHMKKIIDKDPRLETRNHELRARKALAVRVSDSIQREQSASIENEDLDSAECESTSEEEYS